jgi:catechol 2,3-dioxygenase-like lactoylglutathione lyase family enzyme
MEKTIPGIHHVTAIAGDPQANIDFYAGILGLRLVKLTVNFDDPGTYHVYYGDRQGHPGTILTFFPWPRGMRGRIGTGQVTVISFAVPETVPAIALDFWERYLREHNVHCKAEEGYEQTAALLTETMGFRLIESKDNQFRYAVRGSESAAGTMVDVLCMPAGRPGLVSVGTVHHVAWRTPTDEQQAEWRNALRRFNVTPIIDRKYFHSIYFREPGGVLFEIATDPPGFAIDEPAEELGSHLVLPAWLEPHRAELEEVLPRLRLPQAKGVSA